MDTHERLDGPALGAIAVTLLTWSSAYAAIAYALPAFTPGQVAFGRLLIGSICFGLLLAVKRVPMPARRDWPLVALLGVIGMTVYHLCLCLAETRIASGTAAILISLVPAATTALSAIWLGERFSPRALVGLLIALAGVVLVVLASGKQVTFQPMAALVLVCVVCSAIFFVRQKPLFARSSMLGVTAATFFAATLAALPFSLPGLQQHVMAASAERWMALLWLGIAPTFVGYIAWNTALKRAPASQVSSFIYLSPPIAVLIGWLWLDERPTALTLLGGAITLAGVVLTNWKRKVVAVAAPPTLVNGAVES